MNDAIWMRWVMQTARTWDDMSGIIKKIGIDGIDEDHRIFTEYVLELNHVIDAFNSKDIDMDDVAEEQVIFGKLLDYASFHFQREEGIMRLIENPSLETHHRTHEVFVEIITNYSIELKEGRMNMSSGLKLSILDWWVDHINVVDIGSFTPERNEAYFTMLREKGIPSL